jgi:hypothetical protein
MVDVGFITTEDNDDLLVPFAIPVSDYAEVKSLTLLRTPKYEFILNAAEQGVKLFYDDYPDDEDDLLEELEIEGHVVKITTSHRSYTLNIEDLDNDEVKEAVKILKKMNFDQRFRLTIV